jgi:hypothetical protein
MHRSVIPALVATSAFFAGGHAFADDTQLRRYELPNLDTLELMLPAGWVDTVDVPPGGVPLTIQLGPSQGPAFEVHVTPLWSETGETGAQDAEALRESVREAAERIKPQIIEPSIEIKRLQGESGIGFHFSVTDRAPKPEEYRHMTQGGLQTGSLILWFTILTNDDQDGVVAEALAMLQSAVHRGTGQDQR